MLLITKVYLKLACKLFNFDDSTDNIKQQLVNTKISNFVTVPILLHLLEFSLFIVIF